VIAGEIGADPAEDPRYLVRNSAAAPILVNGAGPTVTSIPSNSVADQAEAAVLVDPAAVPRPARMATVSIPSRRESLSDPPRARLG
jgi:hypothetical protein